MVRYCVHKLQRMILCSLITIKVHARDSVTNLVAGKITKRYVTKLNYVALVR
jgi:hypothetical protein